MLRAFGDLSRTKKDLSFQRVYQIRWKKTQGGTGLDRLCLLEALQPGHIGPDLVLGHLG